jgi:hypothetical protein
MFLEFCLRLLKYNPLFLKHLFWDRCCSLYSLMTYVMVIYSRYLLFANDIKLYRTIKSPEHCSLLQSDKLYTNLAH